VFVDFIKKEIALRAARARHPGVSRAIKDFDRAEFDYWTSVTLPQLAKVYAINCSELSLK